MSLSPIQMLLRYFEYKHLPDHLQRASKPFHELAHRVGNGTTQGPETTTALRKLLEAKDCAVRAALNERVSTEEAAP